MSVEYRMSYLKTFTCFSRINSVVKLHMSENLPMKIQYDMDDVVDDDDEDEDVEAIILLDSFSTSSGRFLTSLTLVS